MSTSFRLENSTLALDLTEPGGALTAVQNRVTGEMYDVSRDGFGLEVTGQVLSDMDLTPAGVTRAAGRIDFRFTHPLLTAELRYTLRPECNFAEKHLALTFSRAVQLQRVVLARPEIRATGLEFRCYRQPSYARIENTPLHVQWGARRPPDTEPVRTFFGRTSSGGCFLGMQMPFDSSTLEGNRVTLGFAPSLRLKAGERFECEPAYLGVYARQPADERVAEWCAPDERLAPADLPLPSESAALVAMTTVLLPARPHGPIGMACGWHCQMQQREYASDEDVAGDMRSLDFIKECGLDAVSDSHPWGGETAKMNALGLADAYAPGPRVVRFLEHARALGIKVVQWPTMNHTHPWSPDGRPFLADKAEWRRVPREVPKEDAAAWYRNQPANCFGHGPVYDWIRQRIREALQTGYYGAWCMDGDFWGTGAYYHSTIPVECASEQHDHLPGDANYACQRALDRLTAAVRAEYPDILIGMCRPPMDLGIWSQRNVDSCFTLIESGSGDSNLAAGDEIRTCSRIRVHHHFFPHYLDWPLLFPSYANPQQTPPWPSAHLDYIFLSAFSCAPNLLLYLPTKTGIPAADKAELRQWLDWGRRNVEYLYVRKDLFAWPGRGRVDGSAHCLGDRGIVFLFNPGPAAQSVEFALTGAAIGLEGAGRFAVTQEHPAPGPTVLCSYGEDLRWQVPPETAAVLRVGPANPPA